MAVPFNYLDAPLQFMQNLCGIDRKDLAWSIKSRILEVCEYQREHRDLKKKGDTPNLYQIHAKAAPADGPTHPGYWVSLLVLDRRILVTGIELGRHD
ncbi:MAG: hypothetical protein RRB13_00825 [bacterium]|nr:hypothetical protein [bacterium]